MRARDRVAQRWRWTRLRSLVGAAALCGAVVLCACGGAAAERDAGPPGAGEDAAVPADAGHGAADARHYGDASSDASPTGPEDPSGGSGGAFPGDQERQVDANGDAFSYHLYIPSSYDPDAPIPLVSVFHGQGDTGANIRAFWRDTAEANDFALLATTSTGSSGGWVGGTDAGRHAAALEDALGAYNIDRARLYAWGFSAGAHFVHAIALGRAETFAAYSVSAGALSAFAGTSAPAAASRRIPVDIHIGSEDPLFSQASGDRDRFVAAGWVEEDDLSYVEFDGGHVLLPAHKEEIWAFLSRWTLPE